MATPSPTYIYLVLRKDFDHHTDRKGCLASPIGAAYFSLAAANEAAEWHCEQLYHRARRLSGQPDEPTHAEDKDGLYRGECWVRESRRNHFKVWVSKMKIGDVLPKKPVGGGVKRKSENAVDGGSRRGEKVARTDGKGKENEEIIVLD